MALTQAEERVFTAYQEAGHLAAALAFRVMPRSATIRPSAAHLGLVITADRRSDEPEASAESWLAGLDRLGTHAHAVELMAGLAAEEKAGHPMPYPFAKKDWMTARGLLLDRFEDEDPRKHAARSAEGFRSRRVERSVGMSAGLYVFRHSTYGKSDAELGMFPAAHSLSLGSGNVPGILAASATVHWGVLMGNNPGLHLACVWAPRARMTDDFFSRPILNSPYRVPTQHWELGARISRGRCRHSTWENRVGVHGRLFAR